VLVRAEAPKLRLVHEWLDTWSDRPHLRRHDAPRLGRAVDGLPRSDWRARHRLLHRRRHGVRADAVARKDKR